MRRLENDDLIQFYKLYTIVYNMRRDYTKEDNQKQYPLRHPADRACGVFEGKKLLEGMFEIDYLMRFDGNSVKMALLPLIMISDETKVTGTTQESDIRCDIRALTQLVTGYKSLESAMRSRQKGLEVHGNVELLKHVFTQRPQHITEYF